MLDLSITKNIFKILILLTILKTFTKLKIYFKFIDYIKQYVHFYVSILSSLQNLKTSLLKNKFRNNAKRKTYTLSMKLRFIFKKEAFFKILQHTLNNASILIHFNLK